MFVFLQEKKKSKIWAKEVSAIWLNLNIILFLVNVPHRATILHFNTSDFLSWPLTKPTNI